MPFTPLAPYDLVPFSPRKTSLDLVIGKFNELGTGMFYEIFKLTQRNCLCM